MKTYNTFDDGEVSFIGLLKILYNNSLFIIVFTILIGAFAFGISSLQPNKYSSKIIITFNHPDGATETSAPSFGGIAALSPLNIDIGGNNSKEEEYYAILLSSQNLINLLNQEEKISQYYAKSIKVKDRQVFLQKAINEIRNSLTISRSKVTGITNIYFEALDIEISAFFLNTLINFTNEYIRENAKLEASEKINYLSEESAKTSLRNIQNIFDRLIESQLKNQLLANTVNQYAFKIIDPAIVPIERSSPRNTRNTAIAMVIALFLSMFVIIIRNQEN